MDDSLDTFAEAQAEWMIPVLSGVRCITNILKIWTENSSHMNRLWEQQQNVVIFMNNSDLTTCRDLLSNKKTPWKLKVIENHIWQLTSNYHNVV